MASPEGVSGHQQVGNRPGEFISPSNLMNPVGVSGRQKVGIRPGKTSFDSGTLQVTTMRAPRFTLRMGRPRSLQPRAGACPSCTPVVGEHTARLSRDDAGHYTCSVAVCKRMNGIQLRMPILFPNNLTSPVGVSGRQTVGNSCFDVQKARV